jgi:hypothetical protein
LLAIAAGWMLALPSAVEAGQGVGILSVRASVSPTVAMKFEASSTPLSITEDDIARGYIDVPGTYRLTLNADRTMQHLANITVDYEPNSYNFTSVQVAARTLQTGEPNPYDFASIQVAARALQTGEPVSDSVPANYINRLPPTAAGPSDEPQELTQSAGGVKTFRGAQTVSVRGSVTALGYRLMLPGNIKPGNISVPLTLSLQL